MTKPRTPQSAAKQKAPRASRPAAPLARNPDKPARAERPEGRDPRRNVRPGGKGAGAAASGSERAGSDRMVVGLGRGALINRRAADKLRSGHLWVYASDIESFELPEAGAAGPPALLPVADSRGLLLGTALYSPSSQIALRLVSREAIDGAGGLNFFARGRGSPTHRRKPKLTPNTAPCR